MKKFANPFDSFTAEHTPDDFAVCSWMAVKWLIPYMKFNDKSHCDYIIACEEYSDLITTNARQLDDRISAEEAEMILNLQRKIANTFQQIWTSTVTEQLTVMAINQSKAQSERASKPRKFDSVQEWDRIAKLYWDAKENGTGYGFTKFLAGEYEVSEQAIRNIANQRKPKSIAK
jgi:hypothetical protein